MSKVFSGRVLDAVKTVSAKEPSSTVAPGLYRGRIAESGENRKRNGPYLKIVLAAKDDPEFRKAIGTVQFSRDLEDRSYAEDNIGQFLALAIAAGACTEETKLDVAYEDLQGKELIVGLELRHSNDGSTFNVIGTGAAWPINTDERDITWKPRQAEEQDPQEYFQNQGRGRPPRR